MTTQNTIDRAQLEALVIACVAEELDPPVPASEVEPDRTFVDLGLDSTGVLGVCGRLSDELGFDIEPELLFDHPTVVSLVDRLADDIERTP